MILFYLLVLTSPLVLHGYVLSACCYRAFVKGQSEIQRHSY